MEGWEACISRSAPTAPSTRPSRSSCCPRASMRPARERRFLAERQILARMEHPHIARLLDGGVDRRRHAVLRDGVRRRPAARRVLRRSTRSRPSTGCGSSSCLRGGRFRAPQSGDPSRSQTTNVLVTAEGRSSCSTSASPSSSRGRRRDRRSAADAGLCQPRAAGGPAADHRGRRVGPRGDPLRARRGAPRLRWKPRRRSRTPPPPPSQFRRGLSRDVDTIVLTALQAATRAPISVRRAARRRRAAISRRAAHPRARRLAAVSAAPASCGVIATASPLPRSSSCCSAR